MPGMPNYWLTQLKVYAETWNFRSQLKTDIRVQVRNLKGLFPDGFKGTAEEYQAHVRETISAWVDDGSYLHGTVPNSVCVFTTPHSSLVLTHASLG